jgi:t-SNARE complex subunit (syntaxin)
VEFKKKYNKIREANALKANAKTRRKKYKDIIKELGECQITLDDIANNRKTDGFLYLLDKNGATFDEMVVLQQYSKAIIDRDTKSAEFLRDSSGQKPSTQVDLNDNRSGLAQMSIEELEEMRDLLKKQQTE